MEIYAVILFAIGIILALVLSRWALTDYKDAEWISRMSQRLMPEIKEEVERENIGNSLRTKE